MTSIKELSYDDAMTVLKGCRILAYSRSKKLRAYADITSPHESEKARLSTDAEYIDALRKKLLEVVDEDALEEQLTNVMSMMMYVANNCELLNNVKED